MQLFVDKLRMNCSYEKNLRAMKIILKSNFNLQFYLILISSGYRCKKDFVIYTFRYIMSREK